MFRIGTSTLALATLLAAPAAAQQTQIIDCQILSGVNCHFWATPCQPYSATEEVVGYNPRGSLALTTQDAPSVGQSLGTIVEVFEPVPAPSVVPTATWRAARSLASGDIEVLATAPCPDGGCSLDDLFAPGTELTLIIEWRSLGEQGHWLHHRVLRCAP